MSPWVQAIVSNLCIACSIGGLALFVGRRGRRAPLAHTLWIVFFVKLITPPILQLPFNVPAEWWPSTTAVFDADHASTAVAVQNARSVLIAAPQPGQRAISEAVDGASGSSNVQLVSGWGIWLLIGWATGVLWIVVRGWVRLVRFQRLLQRNGVRDEWATRFVNELVCSNRGGGSRRNGAGPQVLLLPVRVSPMLFSLGRSPTIICPDQLWKSLSESERRAFLAHETAHYCRRDHWLRWLESLVTAVYWWFPGVYFAGRQLERHEEACCDAWAVRKLNSPPRQYAEALLRVIDFISDHRTGMPRLASGMQRTSSLEERLHLVMRGSTNSSPPLRWSVGCVCISLWLVHPVLHPYREPKVVVSEAADEDEIDSLQPLVQRESAAPLGLKIDPADLPEPPSGYWNRTAPPEWANFELALPGVRLVAEARRGITIESLDREPLRFSSEELSALVEVPSTRRVVIGDAAGRLRLWDLTAGTPVSLIGMHPSGVSSLAYHEYAGLVSADDAGSAIRWDLQSGQLLATWTESSGPVQSIRYANDGETLAVLCGNWDQTAQAQNLYIVESRTLRTIQSTVLPAHTAVVLQSASSEWVAVDWSGRVRSLLTNETVDVISKHQVSALVLCQESPLAIGGNANSHLNTIAHALDGTRATKPSSPPANR